jgi:hypothetical protein
MRPEESSLPASGFMLSGSIMGHFQDLVKMCLGGDIRIFYREPRPFLTVNQPACFIWQSSWMLSSLESDATCGYNPLEFE